MAKRRPFDGWPAGTGLAAGLIVGMLTGVGVGRLLGFRALGFVGGLALGVVLGLALDNDRSGDDPPSDSSFEDGSIARALLWLGLGLVALIGGAIAIAPELLQAQGLLSDVLLVVLLAGAPGLLLLLAVIGRRRRIDRYEREERQ